MCEIRVGNGGKNKMYVKRKISIVI